MTFQDSLSDEENRPLINGHEYQQSTNSSHSVTADANNNNKSEGSPDDIPYRRQVVPAKRRIIVEPLMVLFLIAQTPLAPLHEQYFYYKVGERYGIDTNNLSSTSNDSNYTDTCSVDKNDSAYQQREFVQSKSAHWALYLQLAGFLPMVIAHLFWSSFSDKIGRKPLFIIPPIGSIIDCFIHMAIIYFDLPLWTFFSMIIVSLFGGYSLISLGAYSYIADTTQPKNRAMRIIILDIIKLAMEGVTQVAIGYFINIAGFFWPYVFVIGGNILTMLYAIFLIPETIPREKEHKVRKLNYSISEITKSIKIYTKDDGTNRLWKIQLMGLSYLVEIFFMASGIFTLFQMNAPLCMNSVYIGYYGYVSDSVKAVGAFIGAFMSRCISGPWLAVLAKASFAAELLFLSTVQNTIMIFMVPVFGIFVYLSPPMVRAILSNLVHLEEQSSMFAGLSILMELGSLFSGLYSKNLYSATLTIFPGLVFVISAFGVFLSMTCLLVYIYRMRKEKPQAPDTIERDVLIDVDDNDVEQYGSIQ